MIVNVQRYVEVPESYLVTVGETNIGLVWHGRDGGSWRTTPPLVDDFPTRDTAVEALVAAWQRGELPDAVES